MPAIWAYRQFEPISETAILPPNDDFHRLWNILSHFISILLYLSISKGLEVVSGAIPDIARKDMPSSPRLPSPSIIGPRTTFYLIFCSQYFTFIII
jgi:hypothetical protein